MSFLCVIVWFYVQAEFAHLFNNCSQQLLGMFGVTVCLENVFAFSNVWQGGCCALKFHQNTRLGEPDGP